MSTIYNIPVGVSNLLYCYLQGQTNYDLEKLKTQYIAEYASHPERDNIQQILLVIEDIIEDRKTD